MIDAVHIAMLDSLMGLSKTSCRKGSFNVHIMLEKIKLLVVTKIGHLIRYIYIVSFWYLKHKKCTTDF